VLTSYPSAPYTLVPTQLTQDNEDFANRVRFHQSAVGDYDYASLVADSRPLLVNNDHSKSDWVLQARAVQTIACYSKLLKYCKLVSVS